MTYCFSHPEGVAPVMSTPLHHRAPEAVPVAVRTRPRPRPHTRAAGGITRRPPGHTCRRSDSDLPAEGLRRLQEDVVRLGLPDRHPRALTGERPDDHPGLLARLRELHRALPQPQPDEV